ncbi:hypothetical protein D3C81_1714670 [compost metagenome]
MKSSSVISSKGRVVVNAVFNISGGSSTDSSESSSNNNNCAGLPIRPSRSTLPAGEFPTNPYRFNPSTAPAGSGLIHRPSHGAK